MVRFDLRREAEVLTRRGISAFGERRRSLRLPLISDVGNLRLFAGSPDLEVHTSAAAETALLLGLVAIIAAPCAYLTIDWSAYMVGAAIRWLCPEQTWQIQELHDADQPVPGPHFPRRDGGEATKISGVGLRGRPHGRTTATGSTWTSSPSSEQHSRVCTARVGARIQGGAGQTGVDGCLCMLLCDGSPPADRTTTGSATV